METLTYTQLKTKGACKDQLQLFKKLFPDGANLRSEAHAIRLAKAMSPKFDFGWAAENLLTGPAWAAYKKAEAPARAAYKKAQAPALAAYKKVEAPAWAAYREAKAAAFAKAYWSMT